MSDVRHRTVETNGIRMHVAEQGDGPARAPLPRLPRVLVLLAPPARGARGRGLPRGGARHARLRPDRPAGGDRPVHAAPPGRRHGGPGRRAGRRARGDRRPRLGRARRLARRAPAARPLPRGDRAQRAVPAARLGPPVHRRCRRPTTRSSTSSTSRPRAWPRPSSRATCASTHPPPALLGLGRGPAGARRARRSRRGRHGAPRRRLPRATPRSRPRLPAWLTEADVDFYAGEFTRAGFRGGLNWYRNIDRNWELLAPYAGARVTVPALYVAGDRDLVVHFRGMDQLLPNLSKFVPELRRTIMLPGCGHWTQQERPKEVNDAMIAFLTTL